MQLITTRNKEISFVELKKAISSGNGLELIRPGDKFAIELKNGELVNAVCGGIVVIGAVFRAVFCGISV